MILLLFTFTVVLVNLASGNPVSQGDAIKKDQVFSLFVELTKPLDDAKDNLNGFVDSKIDSLMDKIASISPGLQQFVALVGSIKEHLPSNQNQSINSLNELNNHLQLASQVLTDAIKDCSSRRTVSFTETDRLESPGADLLAVKDWATLFQKDSVQPQRSEDSSAITGNLMAQLNQPLGVPEDFVDSILQKYGKNKSVKVEDAGQAVLHVAIAVANKHRNRYLRLLPKVSQVNSLLDEILVNLQTIQVQVLQVLQTSENQKVQVFKNLKEVHDLAQRISNTVNGISCNP